MEWKRKRYVLVRFCSYCRSRLTHTDVMYSHGICPHCGFNSDSTVCDNDRESEAVDDPIGPMRMLVAMLGILGLMIAAICWYIVK